MRLARRKNVPTDVLLEQLDGLDRERRDLEDDGAEKAAEEISEMWLEARLGLRDEADVKAMEEQHDRHVLELQRRRERTEAARKKLGTVVRERLEAEAAEAKREHAAREQGRDEEAEPLRARLAEIERASAEDAQATAAHVARLEHLRERVDPELAAERETKRRQEEEIVRWGATALGGEDNVGIPPHLWERVRARRLQLEAEDRKARQERLARNRSELERADSSVNPGR